MFTSIFFRRTILIIVLLALLILSCGGQPTSLPEPPKPELVGLADFHNHQFGNLGFGGTILSHSVDPNDNAGCLKPLGFDKDTLQLKDLVRFGLFEPARIQAGTCYPTVSSLSSQRMDTDNLKRAWQYGLRLMVMFAVSAEFLCLVADLATPCPSDRVAIDQQIQAAYDLQEKIAKEDGGWYQIVKTPEDARTVIGQGKLAVVLGVEASNAFGGCQFVSTGTVPAIRQDFLAPRIPEKVWSIKCGYGQYAGLSSLQTQEALALFEHYWDIGVRHFYPIHNMNGTAGGTAISVPLLHAENNPSRLKSGAATSPFGYDFVPDIDILFNEVRPPVSSWDCSARFKFDGGRCNILGLTDTGHYLIAKMASYGAVIDIDHTSFNVKRDLRSQGFFAVYPFVSSHSGIAELQDGETNNGKPNEKYEKNNEGQLTDEDIESIIQAGGAFGPILPPATSIGNEDTYPAGTSVAPHRCGGTSESFIQAYRYLVDKLKTGETAGKPAFVGLGFGSEFSAPIPIVAAPRFEATGIDLPIVGYIEPQSVLEASVMGQASHGGWCYLTALSPKELPDVPSVTYPFNAPTPFAIGTPFDRSTTPWAKISKSYDISYSGVVHVGMIPDFVEELRVLGLSDEELKPLWRGAEAYVRTWEYAGLQKSSFAAIDKQVAQDCMSERKSLLAYDFTQPLSTTVQKEVPFILERLRRNGCYGFANQWATGPIGALYLSDNLGNPLNRRIESPSIAAGLSESIFVQLRNRGNSSVKITAVEIMGDPSGALQAKFEPVTLTTNGVTSVGGFFLDFKPSTPGHFEATAVVWSDEPKLPYLTILFVADVNGAPVDVRPGNELEFGSVVRGLSKSMDIELVNNSTENVHIITAKIESSLMIPPPPDGQFSLPAGSPSYQEILPEGSTKFPVVYVPTVDGSADAVLVLEISLGNGKYFTQRVLLHGDAVSPEIGLDPASLEFGAISPGTSKRLTVNLLNTGTADLTISGFVNIQGDWSAFSFDNVQFPLQIAPGQSAQLGVNFHHSVNPGRVMFYVVEFSSNDPDAPKIRLSMRGASSGVWLIATDFISFQNPQPTDTKTVEIENLGDVPATIDQITFDNGTVFELISPPQLPLTINPGQKVTLTIGLTPPLPTPAPTPRPSGPYYSSDNLYLYTNDPQHPIINVGLALSE